MLALERTSGESKRYIVYTVKLLKNYFDIQVIKWFKALSLKKYFSKNFQALLKSEIDFQGFSRTSRIA